MSISIILNIIALFLLCIALCIRNIQNSHSAVFFIFGLIVSIPIFWISKIISTLHFRSFTLYNSFIIAFQYNYTFLFSSVILYLFFIALLRLPLQITIASKRAPYIENYYTALYLGAYTLHLLTHTAPNITYISIMFLFVLIHISIVPIFIRTTLALQFMQYRTYIHLGILILLMLLYAYCYAHVLLSKSLPLVWFITISGALYPILRLIFYTYCKPNLSTTATIATILT